MRLSLLLGAVFGSLLVYTACPKAETSSTGPGQATEVAVSMVPPAPSGAVNVSLKTTDGFGVAGWFWAPKKKNAPCVILLHMRGKDKETFRAVAPKLVSEGYAALAIDLRGHGKTVDPNGMPVRLDTLKEADYQAMLNDVSAAHAYLESIDDVNADRVGIIGASIGANLGIMYAAQEPRVRTVVALSPGMDYKGLRPAGYLEGYGSRALYLVASKGDQYSHESVQALAEAAVDANPVSIREFEGSAHGTDIFRDNPGFDMTVITGWFLNHLPPKR